LPFAVVGANLFATAVAFRVVRAHPYTAAAAFRSLKGDALMARYTGGNGNSVEEAVIIEDVPNHYEGISAEYEWLAREFGPRGEAWELELQALLERDERCYDQMTLRLSNGRRVVVYFDITGFFGEW
jgi:hypothetical protein